MHNLYKQRSLKAGACWGRCMRARLRELAAESLAAGNGRLGQRCERALAMAALAAFLSYLSFGEASGLLPSPPCPPSCYVLLGKYY